jgi:hypothetical protein
MIYNNRARFFRTGAVFGFIHTNYLRNIIRSCVLHLSHSSQYIEIKGLAF